MAEICFINALFPPDFRGGAENYVLRTAQALADRGHRVSVLTTQEYDGLASLRPRKTVVEGVPVWRFYPANISQRSDGNPLGLPGKALWHQIDTVNPHASYVVGQLIDDLGADIVHTNNLMGISTALARSIQKRDVRHVHTLHDYSLICPKSNLLHQQPADVILPYFLTKQPEWAINNTGVCRLIRTVYRHKSGELQSHDVEKD